jgi:ATP-dependent DNA helicase RecQ
VSDSIQSEVIDSLLQTRFGMSAFRRGQREVITSVLARRDTLAVMPTGGGKSLCYQLPALARSGLVVVISPLIALMKDQVRQLRAAGISCGALHSGQEHDEKAAVFADMARSENFLLYVSPERVQKPGFATWLPKQKITLFAIDESHCVSQWGPDFRTDYHRLGLLRQLRPDVPILALTATATPPVLADIVAQLALREPVRQIHGFYRHNLYYQVETCEDDRDKYAAIRAGLESTPEGRILVYCGTRRACEELVTDLGNQFAGVGYYHAGLPTEERTRVQNEFASGKLRILMATNAFGMGIDHPDIRLVMHFQMPANIESLYQEMGRAGRDQKPSTCVLLYSRRDKGLQSHFIRQSQASPQHIQARWKALETLVQFAEGGECRHSGILTYFKDSARLEACGHCDVCDPTSPRRVTTARVFVPRTLLRKKEATPIREDQLPDDVRDRAKRLREWRQAYAQSNDLPAFLVFSNKTLQDLAIKNPATLLELEDVYGFGPHKVETFGLEVLDLLERA